MAIQLKTLQSAPANFPIVIATKNLAGQDVEISFTAIGRTLREWHPIYMKRLSEEANAAAAAAEKAKETTAGADKGESAPIVFNPDEIEAGMEEALQRGATLVREVATGWGLTADFTDDAICDLIAQFPGVQQELHQKYHQAIMGNRVKN